MPEFSPDLQRAARRRWCTAPPAPPTRSTPAPGCRRRSSRPWSTPCSPPARWTRCSCSRSPPASPTAAPTMAELVRVRAGHPELPVLGVPLGGLPDAQRRATPRSRPTGRPPRRCGPSAARCGTPSGSPTRPSPARAHRPGAVVAAARARPASCSASAEGRWLERGRGRRRCSAATASRCSGPPPHSAAEAVECAAAARVPGGGEGGRPGRRAQDRARPGADRAADPGAGARGLPRLPGRRRPRARGARAADGLRHRGGPRAGARPVDGSAGDGRRRRRGHRRLGRPRLPGAAGLAGRGRREPSARCGSRGCSPASAGRPPATWPGWSTW